ncbi:MAG: hypothetical protein NZ483_04880 [Verrucomicrobiae bacterium]|nr:hypothetical protein [Verrucomicrobiae bacterium]MDW8344019.1 hypothetical protein [Verrucomicrobiae bacterium]
MNDGALISAVTAMVGSRPSASHAAGKLHETDLQAIPPRERERDFRITDRHLQIGPPGLHGLHYDEVRGPFAFLDSQFNIQPWLALPPVTTDSAPTTNK